MRSTKEEQPTPTGLSNTRSYAQNPKTAPKGFGKPIHSAHKVYDPSEGLNRPFDVWFDYQRLSLTIGSREDVTDICDFVMGKFNDVMVWEDKPRVFQYQHWDNVGASAGGILMNYRLPDRDSDLPGEMVIIFKGDVIESIERHRLLWMWYCLWKDYSARSTRKDIKLDDFWRQLDMDWLKARTRDGSVYRLRTAEPIEKYGSGGKLIANGANFGSRESEIHFRCYDKYLESKGKENWNRVEGRFGGDTANHLFNQLMTFYDSCKHERNAAQILSTELVQIIFNMTTGLMFLEQNIDEDGHIDSRNRGRNKVLDYWHNFKLEVYKFFSCDGLTIDPKKPVKKPSLERCINFLQRSVGNAFSSVSIAYGKEYAESLITKGFEQLSRTHKAMVNKTRKEMENAMLEATDKVTQLIKLAQQSGLEECDG